MSVVIKHHWHYYNQRHNNHVIVSKTVFSRSHLVSLLFFVKSSLSAVRAQDPVEGYLYVGTGWCQNTTGNYFDAYRKDGVEDAVACGSACMGLGIDGLRGFNLYNDQCSCCFQDGVVKSSPLPDGFVVGDTTWPGIGEIVSSDGSYAVVCYKATVSIF